MNAIDPKLALSAVDKMDDEVKELEDELCGLTDMCP